RGLKRGPLESICRMHGAYVAIVNAEDRMVVGGTRTALDAVIRDAAIAGAQRTTMLPVRVAGHTPLLADASDAFRQALAKAPVAAEVPPSVRLLSGIDGATVFDMSIGADKLARRSEEHTSELQSRENL